MSRQSATLDIEGRPVTVTNLAKVFYPKTGFTKGDVIDYYVRVSAALLPHLRDRPISLKRYPDGVEGFFFYEKQCPAHRPKWMKTTRVSKSDGGEIRYCVMNSLPALVWAANLADLELHTFLHRAPAVGKPTALAFDLDPGPPADIVTCCRVGLMVRKIFAEAGLESFPKTSGSKGLQVYVPLNKPITYEKTKAAAHAIARELEHAHPDLVLSRMEKAARRGKVFVDWSQNDAKKTTVNVYSLRARERPTVSTPVTWDEVEHAHQSKRPLAFEAREVLERLERHGDLFAPVLTLSQKLPAFS